MSWDPEEANAAFAATCPELTSAYARYPIDFKRWLDLDEMMDGEKVFQKSEIDNGLKENYVWCKNGPRGQGYYHLLTQISYVNLYSRIANSAHGSACCSSKSSAQRIKIDQWDITRRIVYNRTRSSRPCDSLAAEAAIDHQVGTAANPLHGLKL
mmetsp:Transcript_119/g.222  ORF Transcript_119/g.222 Transcript_119/m.222 type:complete len:154 (-) Transcript_119:179-640(-)